MSASWLALDDKVWPVNKHLKDGIPTHWVSWNWDLNPRAMRKWGTREMKQDILHGRAGRPVPLTDSSKEKLLDHVLGFTTYDKRISSIKFIFYSSNWRWGRICASQKFLWLSIFPSEKLVTSTGCSPPPVRAMEDGFYPRNPSVVRFGHQLSIIK